VGNWRRRYFRQEREGERKPIKDSHFLIFPNFLSCGRGGGRGGRKSGNKKNTDITLSPSSLFLFASLHREGEKKRKEERGMVNKMKCTK